VPKPEPALPFTVEPDAGPRMSLTARSAAGLLSEACHRYSLIAGEHGVQRSGRPIRPRVVAPGDVLMYAVYPRYDPDLDTAERDGEWFDDGFAATGVALDLVFDDGTRMSERRPIDQHGFAAGPESQGQSRSLVADQWNLKAIDLTPFAHRTVVAIEVLIAAHRAPAEGWLDGPHFRRQDEPAPEFNVDAVVTTRGTNSSSEFSRGNTIPAAAVPSAFTLVTPVTDAEDMRWPYKYHEHNDERNRPGLEALALSHSPTPWLGDYGVLHLLPSTRGVDASAEPNARRLAFTHDAETARPYLYRVATETVTVSVAPTRACAIAEISFSKREGQLIIDVPRGAGALHIADGGRQVSGWSDSADDPLAGAPRMFFVLRLDHPIRSSRWDDQSRVTLDFALPARTLAVRVATSFIDLEHAEAALDREIGERALADIAEAARQSWEEILGRFRLDGASDDQRVTFYSNLYRMFLYPSEAHELSALDESELLHRVPRVQQEQECVTGPLTTNNGFWDTYRTVWPAYALFAPSRASRLLEGILQHYVDTGWVPRWTAPGARDCMVGTSSDVVFADAAMKGVPFDAAVAFESAVKAATAPSASPVVGRKGLQEGVFRGYISSETPEGLSWTLENAVSDSAIANLAEKLAEEESASDRRDELLSYARYFRGRAASFRLMFDPETRHFRGRNASGAFAAEEFDPFRWGGDFTETNGWGMTFTAPHAGAALAELFGGPSRLGDRLDEFFALRERGAQESIGTYGRVIHEMREARSIRMGMWAPSNQPAHHIPYMYAFTGTPHKTQAITREALGRLFIGSEIGQGYPGDEDNGEMSAWFVFSALGLYPLDVGTPMYVLTAPLFPRAEIELENGGRLEIRARAQGAGDVYIQSVRIDGEPWPSVFLPHELVSAGGVLEFDLGPEPSAWGQGSVSGQPLVRPWRDLPVAPASLVRDARLAPLIDDAGGTAVAVNPGEPLEWWTTERASIEIYTLTCPSDPAQAPTAWTLEASADDGQTWKLLDARDGVVFPWPRQTKPFAVDGADPCNRYRLTIRGDTAGYLSQIELLTSA
jgi:predicted alpha-1,2-mannosidase